MTCHACSPNLLCSRSATANPCALHVAKLRETLRKSHLTNKPPGSKNHRGPSRQHDLWFWAHQPMDDTFCFCERWHASRAASSISLSRTSLSLAKKLVEIFFGLNGPLILSLKGPPPEGVEQFGCHPSQGGNVESWPPTARGKMISTHAHPAQGSSSTLRRRTRKRNGQQLWRNCNQPDASLDCAGPGQWCLLCCSLLQW